MKIACIADLHLNKATYKNVMDRDEFTSLPFRCGDFMRAFRWSVNECIKLKVDLLVIGGDTYDTYSPNNEVRGFFSLQLQRLISEKIPVIILVGNHDICMKHSALSDIEELGLKNIKVFSEPGIINLENGGKKFRLLLFPHTINMERKLTTIRKEYDKFVSTLPKDPSDTTLFFGHFPVYGCVMNHYNLGEDSDVLDSSILMVSETKKTVEETDQTTTLILKGEYKNVNKEDLNASDLVKSGAQYIFMGDFHEHQAIVKTQKCKGWYCGSLEKNSLNEKEHTKGFMVYDSSKAPTEDMGCCEFIPNPYVRPMMDLPGNIVEMREKLEKFSEDKYQDVIVRLNFKGTKEEMTDFTVNLESFKKEISSRFNAIHIYHNIDSIENNAGDVISKIEKQIQSKGHMDAVDVLEVVKEMVCERVTDDNEKEKIVELATEIYKETMGA